MHVQEMLDEVRKLHEEREFRSRGGEDSVWRLALLLEEVGELAAAVTKGDGDPASELADILICVLGSCLAEGVDIEAEFRAKMSKVRTRQTVIRHGHARLANVGTDNLHAYDTHDNATSARLYIALAGQWDTEARDTLALAEAVGEEIARQGHVLITGGGGRGSMEAARRGAQRLGGITVELLPDIDRADANESTGLSIVTGLGYEGRSMIMVRTSDAVIVIGGANGTLGEISMAYLNKRPVVVLTGSGGCADRLPAILLDGAYLDERRNVPVAFATSAVESVAMAVALASATERSQVEGG